MKLRNSLVLGSNGAQFGQNFCFAARGFKLEMAVHANVGRNRLLNQFIQRGDAQGVQHLLHLGPGGAEVPVYKMVSRGE